MIDELVVEARVSDMLRSADHDWRARGEWPSTQRATTLPRPLARGLVILASILRR